MGKFFGGTSKSDVGKVFKKIDTDGSGDLSWEEFESAITRRVESEEGV